MQAQHRRALLVHPPSPADVGMFDAPVDDPGHAPWIHIRNRLSEIGYDIAVTYKNNMDPKSADWILFMNMPSSLRASERRWTTTVRHLLRGDQDFYAGVRSNANAKLALFLWEPAVVMPDNFDPHAHQQFDRVFTWHAGLLARNGRYYRLFWPQPSVVPQPSDPPFSARKLLVNFSARKRSSHSNELYSARAEVIRYMEARHAEAFDHYGPGWTAEFPSWRGTVPSKHDVYPRYRFGLCYENMHSTPGFVTEKIFDCLRAGTVPVYWGAPDITAHVDEEAFVDRRAFRSTGEMIEHLLRMTEPQWEALRTAGRRYLQSPRFEKFLPEAFFRALCEGLRLRS